MCRHAPMKPRCTGGAAVHLWCCCASVVLPCTDGAAVHRWCRHAPLVPLCTGGAAVHRWCRRAPLVPPCTGGAAVLWWCRGAQVVLPCTNKPSDLEGIFWHEPVVLLCTGGATINCRWHSAMAMLIMVWSLDTHCNERVGVLVLCTATALSFLTPEIKFWFFLIFSISNYTREMNKTSEYVKYIILCCTSTLLVAVTRPFL